MLFGQCKSLSSQSTFDRHKVCILCSRNEKKLGNFSRLAGCKSSNYKFDLILIFLID